MASEYDLYLCRECDNDNLHLASERPTVCAVCDSTDLVRVEPDELVG